MKQAMILAAGLGTRLKPLTDSKPKALVEIGGKTLLSIVIAKLKEQGFDRIIINVHHFGEQIIDYVKKNNNFDTDMAISDERGELLDTGGAIKRAKHFFNPTMPVLIHNVDIIGNADLAAFYDKSKTAGATLLVSKRQSKRLLSFDKNMHLLGRWNPENNSETDKQIENYAFAGIHCIAPKLISAMDDYPNRFGIIDFYIDQCRKTSVVGVVQEGLQILDVGKIDVINQINTLDIWTKS